MKHRIRIKNGIAYTLIALTGLISALLILRAFSTVAYIEEDTRLTQESYQHALKP